MIKTFNNIYSRHLLELGRPAGAPGRIALPVAGDDHAAKTVVLNLVEELGFDGVDAGSLDESWRQQPSTPVYTKDFNDQNYSPLAALQPAGVSIVENALPA